MYVDFPVLPLANRHGGTGRLQEVVDLLSVDLEELAPHAVGDVGPLLHRFSQQVVHPRDNARDDALVFLRDPVKLGCFVVIVVE